MSDDDGDEPHDGKTFRFVCHAKGDVALSTEKVGNFSLPTDDEASGEDALQRLTHAIHQAYGDELSTGTAIVLRGADGSVLCTAEDLQNYVRSVQEHAAARGPIIFFREPAVAAKQWMIPLSVKWWSSNTNSGEPDERKAVFSFALPWRSRPVSHLAVEGDDGVFDDGPLSALRKTCLEALHADDTLSYRFAAVVSYSPSRFSTVEASPTSIATDKQVEEYFALWVHNRKELEAAGPDEIEEMPVDVAVLLEDPNAMHSVNVEFVVANAESFVPLLPNDEHDAVHAGDVRGGGYSQRRTVQFQFKPSRMHGVLQRLKHCAVDFLRSNGHEMPSEPKKGNDDDDDDDWATAGEASEHIEAIGVSLIAETTVCGDIALTNDWAVENVFNQLTASVYSPLASAGPAGSPLRDEKNSTTHSLRIRISLNESTEIVTVTVHCRLREGSSAPGATSESHKFVYRFAPDESNLVSQLRSACSANVGGAPLTAADTMLCTLDDGQEVQIGSDAMLRELLRSHAELEQPILVTVQRKRKAVVIERLVVCQLADDKAQFSFRFVVDDNNLVESFREECKAEMDLLPSDNASLFAQVSTGETVPLAKDSVLREVLTSNRDEPLHVLIVRKPPSGRRGSRTSDPPSASRLLQRTVECSVGRKKAQFVFSFRIDEEGLLDHLHTCCKQAHSIPVDSRVKLVLHHLDANIMCSRDLGTDVQLRDVLADEADFPSLNINALVVSKRAVARADSTPTSAASPVVPPSRDLNVSAGTYSELDGASLDSRTSTRERRKIQDFDEDSVCDDNSSCPAPTPPAYRRASSWNDVADENPARLPPTKKPSLYDCFADEGDDDSVMRDNSDRGDSGPSQKPAVKRNLSSANDVQQVGAGLNVAGNVRHSTAPTDVSPSNKIDAAVEANVAPPPTQQQQQLLQPQLSPSPPPREKKPAIAHHIRSLGPTSLQPVKKFRVVGDPIVDLIERRMRERRAAEKARREKERQRMDEVMSEIETRRQKHLDELKEFQLVEQRRKQEESERRAEEIRRREEERLKRISNLKVDSNIILGKKSVLDVLEEKRRKVQLEEEERIIKARVEARERLSWNQHFHQQLDEHQQQVLERARRREQEKKAHPPVIDQPIVPADAADIIKTNAYMRVVQEAHMPQRSAHERKEELRRQREARMSYYDRQLEGGEHPPEVHPYEHRPVEYPSRVRGEEAKKEELRKMREARMTYYDNLPPAATSGEGSAGEGNADSMNSSNPGQPRRGAGAESGPARPALVKHQDEATPAKPERHHSSKSDDSTPPLPQPPPEKQQSTEPRRSRRHHESDQSETPSEKHQPPPPIDVSKHDEAVSPAASTSPSTKEGAHAESGLVTADQTPRRRSSRRAVPENSPKAPAEVTSEMLPPEEGPLPPSASELASSLQETADETPRAARRRKSRQKEATPPLEEIPHTVDDEGDDIANQSPAGQQE